MVNRLRILNNIEENRSIEPALDLAKSSYNTEKRLKKQHHQNVLRNLKQNKKSTLDELIRYNQECALTSINYNERIKRIRERKMQGYIVVDYNNSILYDLSTMQMIARKKVYKKDNSGTEKLKDNLVTVDQQIDGKDISSFSSIVSENIYLLREIAYLYFKNSKKANLYDFKRLIEELTNRSSEKYITLEEFDKLYNYLIRKELVVDSIPEKKMRLNKDRYIK